MNTPTRATARPSPMSRTSSIARTTTSAITSTTTRTRTSTSTRGVGAAWWVALMVLIAGALPGGAQERKGAFIEEIEDEDGDKVVLMESEWISMRLMPAIGSTVLRFVFRPTQNEILDLVDPKNLKVGGGLLQDNIWEQDWRFQELRGKWYDYVITKRGPDEVQVVFETKLAGWIGADKSGIKSRLLEDVKIRRTVTLQQGTPYFLFDVEFIDEGDCAKLPLYWAHNGAVLDMVGGDHVFRPSDIGIREIPGDPAGDYVYNFNQAWTAAVAPARREGVVYLMDYDYLRFLYNCGTATTEWVYDNLLILRNRPVKTRIYILPTMGLEKVDHATEYFIAQVKPVRANGELRIQYKLTASYNPVRKITLVPELVYNLGGSEAERKRATLPAVTYTELGVEPQLREAQFTGVAADPVIVRTTAFIDLADGTQQQRVFEYFHIGDYSLGRNVRKDLTTPMAKLDRRTQNPFIPVPAENLAVNRKDFRVFAVMGANSRVLGLEEALRSIPNIQLEVGYHPGFEVYQTGLTDFPYDYDRLFNYRVMVLNNSIFDMARFVGMSILTNWLDRGGGLVYGGGENVLGLTPLNAAHPVYKYLPAELHSRIVKQTVQLNSPVKEHPVFKGVNLENLPYTYFLQQATVRKDGVGETKVLLQAGDQPFIVASESKTGQRTVLVLGVPLGDKADNPGKPVFYEWSEWKKLYANLVRYAAHDL